jgi:hypothetical protein
MTLPQVLILLLAVAGCTSREDLCFVEATRAYVATSTAISQSEKAAAQGFIEAPDRLEFTDVSSCGPTLEAREICTTQSSTLMPGDRPVDPVAEARRAASLRDRLPELRRLAEHRYRLCLVNGPGG